MMQATDIQTYASDIRQTAELIEALLVSIFNNGKFKDKATETELEAISERPRVPMYEKG